MKTLLERLTTAAGVGGQTAITETVTELLRPYCTDIQTDRFGNVTAFRRCGKQNAPVLLLEAHIDEIGFVVTGVDEKGFVRVDACGGIDRRTLPATEVTVWADKPYAGVFCSVPPHLAGEDDPLPEVSELGIDVGLTAAEAKAAIPVGTRVSFRPHFETLAGERVCAKALDDRAGVAAVLHALKLLDGRELSVDIAVLFAVQEELAMRGATTGAFALCPDEAIAVDVSFALTHDSDPAKCAILGGGTMIGVSPILDAAMIDTLEDLADRDEILWQPEGMGSRTGTDADVLSISRTGVRTALLSIPLRYMHTPVEVVDVRDVEATARLLAAYAVQGGVAV